MSNFNTDFELHGVDVVHLMPSSDDGVYIKRVDIPAGVVLENHSHTFTHKSILAIGRAIVCANGVSREIIGPTEQVIERGVPHSVEALTPCVWYCIHATDETDPRKIDHTLIEGG